MIIPNKRQKITAIVFTAILTLMCLFPPTRLTVTFLTYSKEDMFGESTTSSGFRYIGHLGSVSRGYPKKSYSIDTAQLLLQVFVACLAGVAILYALNEPQKKD